MRHRAIRLSSAQAGLKREHSWNSQHSPEGDPTGAFFAPAIAELTFVKAKHRGLNLAHNIGEQPCALRIVHVVVAIHEGAAGSRVAVQVREQNNLVVLVKLFD